MNVTTFTTYRSPLLSVQLATVKTGTRSAKQCFGPFTFSIQPGERIAILGPSGAGKSTLLKLLAAEYGLDGGHIWLNARELQHWPLPALSRYRALLPQSHEVAFGLQTDLVIALGRVARMPDPKLQQIIRDAASQAHASHLLGRRFDTLSGGEKARIQLARVFAQLWDSGQALLLIDEPLAALDPGLQLELMQSIQQFADERQHAVLAVLHDINQALSGFQRLLLIHDGSLVADLPSSIDALPQLESLYGIQLQQATTAQGRVFLMPAAAQT